METGIARIEQLMREATGDEKHDGAAHSTVTAATIVTVGPLLDATLQAVADMDVTVLYCTTIAPFDGETLRQECTGGRVVLIEPYYEGGLTMDIMAALRQQPICLETLGVPHEVLSNYGTLQQHDEALGLTPQGMRQRIRALLDA